MSFFIRYGESVQPNDAESYFNILQNISSTLFIYYYEDDIYTSLLRFEAILINASTPLVIPNVTPYNTLSGIAIARQQAVAIHRIQKTVKKV